MGFHKEHFMQHKIIGIVIVKIYFKKRYVLNDRFFYILQSDRHIIKKNDEKI